MANIQWSSCWWTHHFIENHRSGRCGGGVGIFLKRNYSFYLGDKIVNTIFLSSITVEIDEIFRSLRKSAPGHDELTTDILKLGLPYIKLPLLYVLNLSLKQGVFPKELKIANVIPLFKAEDPMKFNNYRPVSLLCILSKVFEKVMYSRLFHFLESFKILIENQFWISKATFQLYGINGDYW